MRDLAKAAALVAAIVASVGTARAAPITYTISADEFIELGPLASAVPVPVSVTGTGDTADAVDLASGVIGVPLTSVTFGTPVGSGTITTLLDFVSEQSAHTGGFFTATGLSSVLAESATFFTTYDAITSAGPISGLPADSVNVSVAVTTGSPIETTLLFGDAGNSYSFSAVTTRAVPEPMTLALLGVGVLGITTIRRRRRG